MSNSINIANSPEELKSYLDQTIKASNFRIEETSLSNQSHWNFKNGVLSHKSGGFFHITGLIEEATLEERLVLYQPQGAFNGMIVCKKNDTAYVMLQARIEPGNTGIGQYGPTIQSTPANYLRLHKGKATPYLNYFFGFEPSVRPISNSTQLDIGKRYYQKTKILSYVEVSDLVETEANMIWVSIDTLKETVAYDHFLNTDLRSMLGVFDWDLYLGHQQNSNLHINILPQIQGKNGSHFGKPIARLESISKLHGWSIGDNGINDNCESGLSVKMFKTSCINREVAEWSQPLYCCDKIGLIILCIRNGSKGSEILVTVGKEFGIPGERVLLPSFISYPPETPDFDYSSVKVLSEMEQSEEGGRFYQNSNKYQIVEVNDNFKIHDNQIWLNKEQYDQILKTSNLLSIQLRCISSMILNITNTKLQ